MTILEEYERFANNLLNKHQLTDWVFVWNNRISTKLGICRYRTKEIHINKRFASVAPSEEVVDTIMHEVAHALTEGDGHGEKWKAKCRELGCKDEEFANLSDELLNKLEKYKGLCPTCGHKIYTSRRRTIIHIQCSNKEYRETGRTDYMKHAYKWFKN